MNLGEPPPTHQTIGGKQSGASRSNALEVDASESGLLASLEGWCQQKRGHGYPSLPAIKYEVSWNRAIPKSSIYRWFFHEINHPAMGVPHGYGNPEMAWEIPVFMGTSSVNEGKFISRFRHGRLRNGGQTLVSSWDIISYPLLVLWGSQDPQQIQRSHANSLQQHGRCMGAPTGTHNHIIT